MRTACLLNVSCSIPCIGGGVPIPGMVSTHPHPRPREQTHTHENITFSQLRMRAVKTLLMQGSWLSSTESDCITTAAHHTRCHYPH